LFREDADMFGVWFVFYFGFNIKITNFDCLLKIFGRILPSFLIEGFGPPSSWFGSNNLYSTDFFKFLTIT
jgi:hypothetical protein